MKCTSAYPFAILIVFTLPFGCGDAPSSPGDDGSPTVPDVSWLEASALPFDTAGATGEYADLMPLKEWIGDARVVALGEATHGTREFFLMKHRILEFLNAELGFNVFAIEATFPEARRVNRYVRTGEGDAAELLAGLYFWIWNTEEVLDMIEWMRMHNEAPGRAPPVSFFGFDMQFPRVAMDDVVAYLEGVNHAAASFAREVYACYREYENPPIGSETPWWGDSGAYADAPDSVKARCRAGVVAVHDTLAARREMYVRASSADEYEWALRSARIVVQNEEMRRVDDYPPIRDAYMAENAAWLIERAGAGSKVVLWAHNLHVGYFDGFMGGFLREEYGADLVTVGFAFHHGSFNAWQGGRDGAPATHRLGPPVEGSYEHYFGQAGLPRFILDLRRVHTAPPETYEWMRGPHPFRWFGCCYDPDGPQSLNLHLPADFDLIVYFEEMTPSRMFGDPTP